MLPKLEVVYRYGPDEGGLGYPTFGTHCWGAKGLGAHNPSRTSPSVMNLPESSHVHTLGVTVALCARV